jgi:hypothetical protein
MYGKRLFTSHSGFSLVFQLGRMRVKNSNAKMKGESITRVKHLPSLYKQGELGPEKLNNSVNITQLLSTEQAVKQVKFEFQIQVRNCIHAHNNNPLTFVDYPVTNTI